MGDQLLAIAHQTTQAPPPSKSASSHRTPPKQLTLQPLWLEAKPMAQQKLCRHKRPCQGHRCPHRRQGPSPRPPRRVSTTPRRSVPNKRIGCVVRVDCETVPFKDGSIRRNFSQRAWAPAPTQTTRKRDGTWAKRSQTPSQQLAELQGMAAGLETNPSKSILCLGSMGGARPLSQGRGRVRPAPNSWTSTTLQLTTMVAGGNELTWK